MSEYEFRKKALEYLDNMQHLLGRVAFAVERPVEVNVDMECDCCHENSCTCHTTEPVDPVEEPAVDEPLFGEITVDKVALRFEQRFNESGYPVMIIWNKKLPVAQRRRFEMRDTVMLGDKVRADGGVRYYHVLNDVDGFDKPMPEEPDLFLPEWAVDLVD